jgi:hypothetical protein
MLWSILWGLFRLTMSVIGIICLVKIIKIESKKGK